MRLIKMTGGLGNQMFIYAMYMNMKRAFPDTCIDLSDMPYLIPDTWIKIPTEWQSVQV